MNEARFWIGVADQFAAAGNETSANQASNEAGHFLGLAEGALNDMASACGPGDRTGAFTLRLLGRPPGR